MISPKKTMKTINEPQVMPALYINRVLKSLAWLALSLLTACNTLQAPLQCPHGGGIPCARIDQIEVQLNHSNNPLGLEVLKKTTQVQSKPKFHAKRRTHYPQALTLRYHTAPVPVAQKMTAGNYLSVWIAPYQDSEGNYHQAQTIWGKVF